nr:MAG TPA: anaerobic ribonucleoside triphosphate reductase [Bacteriophage sp.]
MKVLKRNGRIEDFNLDKVINAVIGAYKSQNIEASKEVLDEIKYGFNYNAEGLIGVEEIQDQVEKILMDLAPYKVAKSFILYREKHRQARFVRERIDYMNKYSESSDNAATSSETDANANVTMKNVANLEGEVYKTTNRIIQRQRMKDKLNEMYPEVAKQYEKDLEHHIIYAHDEASTPVLKNYCEAVSLYPLMLNGVGEIDGVTPKAPTNLDSFCGQFVNLAFLLASQCKGAVAFGGFFVAFNYYCVKEWGSSYYYKDSIIVDTDYCNKKRTIGEKIIQAFQQCVWGINQPAGNRGYQSPFINFSYYDSNYFKALFGEFFYPDGTKPEWEAIDYLQRKFMKYLNAERLNAIIAMPVETMALLSDGKDIIDKEYKKFTAEMYAEGHSFFTYISDNPNGLASCCRLRNEIEENTFSFTNGLTGIQTGSVHVITLNINRIVQDYFRWFPEDCNINCLLDDKSRGYPFLKKWLINILDRVYKYHIAYKTMLYDMEDKGMLTSSKAGYIYMKKLYSTIGLNGINEAAEFLGIKCSYNKEYMEFCNLITSTIKEQNKIHNIRDKKRPFLFNTEFVPAESLGVKNYNWDKEDGYMVNPDRNLYNSYFYIAHDDTSVLDKFRLHGRNFTSTLDGGVGCHINLEDHLSVEQYTKLIEFAVKEGTSYFTFNIPNSECEECGYITKHPITECPKCSSKSIKWYTRIIGYLRAIKNFGKERQIEAEKRTYSKGINECTDCT